MSTTIASTTPIGFSWVLAIDVADLDGLMEGYGLPDYGGPRTGVGLYVDLYNDPLREVPVGRLWRAAGDRLGLVHVADENELEYTKIALRLRILRSKGVPAEQAFDEVAGDYTAGAVFEGPLEPIADPAILGNEGI